MSDTRRPNMPPADELELVRAEIKRLRAREAELKAAMLDGGGAAGDLAGRDWRVEVVEQRRRSLDRAALPPEIAADPRYWKESVTRIVRTVPAGARTGPRGGGEEG